MLAPEERSHLLKLSPDQKNIIAITLDIQKLSHDTHSRVGDIGYTSTASDTGFPTLTKRTGGLITMDTGRGLHMDTLGYPMILGVGTPITTESGDIIEHMDGSGCRFTKTIPVIIATIHTQ